MQGNANNYLGTKIFMTTLCTMVKNWKQIKSPVQRRFKIKRCISIIDNNGITKIKLLGHLMSKENVYNMFVY